MWKRKALFNKAAMTGMYAIRNTEALFQNLSRSQPESLWQLLTPTHITKKREELKEEENQQEKLARMQYLLQKLISDAVRSNNQTLVDELSSQMKENICKEMDYQFRLLEEHEEERENLREAREEKREKARRELEEEHYKKIDAMLRNRREKSEKSKNKENVLFRVLSKSKA